MERDKRFTYSGVNSAGDAVYARTYGRGYGEGGTDYESKTVEELKELLKHMALPVSGTKAELIERLEEAE